MTIEKVKKIEGVLHGRHSFASVEMVTEPKMRKKENPYYGKVKKIMNAVVMIGNTYQNAVNNRRGREGKESDFETEKPKGKHFLDGSKIILARDDNTAYYLRLYFMAANKPNVKYIDDSGNEIDKNEIESFLYAPSKSVKQGIDNEVILRDVKIENVKRVKFGGIVYE